MALQEDDDTTGDVISVNGQAADAPSEKEDRGDDFMPPTDDTPDTTGEAAQKDSPATDPPQGLDAPVADKPDHGIPKARFNEVIGERNALKEQLAEANRIIESAKAPVAVPPAAEPPALDEMAMEKQYLEALLDGDSDKAAGIRMQINAAIREQAAQDMEVRQTRAQAANALTAASQQAVADYPYLDTEDGAEAIELIVAARDRKAAAGMPLAEALRAAVALIAPKFAPANMETPTDGLTAQRPAADTRTAAALVRGAADSSLQPPAVQAGTGARAGAARVSVADLTEEQFENLSTADKRRLRGDS